MSKAVVAVSGGVDSVVLLHMLSTDKSYDIVVAHFDHGIRADSSEDADFVANLAGNYGFDFVLGEGNLGNTASEAEARQARYRFLTSTREDTGASYIITAHHQDDEIETAIINILRGTSHRGMLPMRANQIITRPLLDTSKQSILNYAKAHKLKWREDPSNLDASYLRNHIRQKIMPRLAPGSKERTDFLKLIRRSSKAGAQLSKELSRIHGQEQKSLERGLINNLPYQLGCELVADWLRLNGFSSFNSKTIERLTMAAKTGRSGSWQPLNSTHRVHIGKTSLKLELNG